MSSNTDIKGLPPPLMNTNDPRQFIKNFSFDNCKLGNQGFQRLLIQLFGLSGHGKSSFINTCKIVLENSAYINYTMASGSYAEDTIDRKTYQLTENIFLVDNRCCSNMGSYEKRMIFAQLANLMPLNVKVDWCQGFTLANRIVEAEPLVKSSDFLVPLFIYSVAEHSFPTPDEKENMKEILKTCRDMTGVDASVVLTHKMKGDVKKVAAMFKDFGIQHVLSLENYTSENHSRSAEVDNSVIQFLREAVQDAKFCVDLPRDREKEMMDRKIFVLNYIHNKELETHRQRLEKQATLENERAMKTRRETEEKK